MVVQAVVITSFSSLFWLIENGEFRDDFEIKTTLPHVPTRRGRHMEALTSFIPTQESGHFGSRNLESHDNDDSHSNSDSASDEDTIEVSQPPLEACDAVGGSASQRPVAIIMNENNRLQQLMQPRILRGSHLHLQMICASDVS
ncbi:hypothetical protein Leryth_016993 [Lithospermum erythrorhizon]|nr:hypothetical protein Leryth_016993 [Lithospermum erythrorhizon]